MCDKLSKCHESEGGIIIVIPSVTADDPVDYSTWVGQFESVTSHPQRIDSWLDRAVGNGITVRCVLIVTVAIGRREKALERSAFFSPMLVQEIVAGSIDGSILGIGGTDHGLPTGRF